MAISRIDQDFVYAFLTTATSNPLDVGTGSDRCVLAWVSTNIADAVNSVTVGGEELTLIASADDGSGSYGRRYLYGKANVSVTGSQTVVFNCNTSNLKYGIVASYSGVGSIRGGGVASNISAGTSAGPTVTVTTVSGDTVVLLGHDMERGTTFTAASPAVAFTISGAGGSCGAQETASSTSTTIDGTWSSSGNWTAGAAVLVPLGGGLVELTGSITLSSIEPTGTLGLNPAQLGASTLTLDNIAPTGTLGISPGTVTTLPFSRNTGSRPTGLTGIAVAILSDDANMTRLAGATSLSQDGAGRVVYSGAGLPAFGTSVLVVTREPDGKLGLERYTVQ